MYTDPEKAYKEKMLIKEIDRLEGLLFGEEKDQAKDLEFAGKVADALEETRKELNKLWNEIRSEHIRERKEMLNLLKGIFAALVFIGALLFFRS